MREPQWKSYTAKIVEPILTPAQCQTLIQLGQAQPKVEGEVLSSENQLNRTQRQNTVSWIPFSMAQEIYGIIYSWMERTNSNFFGFEDIKAVEPGQYAEYSKGDFYDWHIDIPTNMIRMPPVRKISMSLLLNDPKEFKGGDLDIFNGTLDTDGSDSEIGKLKQGQPIFFASFQLHRVRPILEGNRKALIMWFGGTPFK